jgi:DNA-binding PadR family transcriptional regulator
VAELPVVAVMALALLHEEPMHPYEIFRTLEQRCETRLARINAGAIYHAVDKLVAEGLAEPTGTEREGKRPERTTYRATEAGTVALLPRLTSLLADDHPAYPPFAVGLAEAPHLPRAQALDALAARRDRLAAAQAWSRSTLTKLREQRNLPLRFVLDVDHESAMLAAEVAWLDDIINRLETDPEPWESDQRFAETARVGAVPHPASLAPASP